MVTGGLSLRWVVTEGLIIKGVPEGLVNGVDAGGLLVRRLNTGVTHWGDTEGQSLVGGCWGVSNWGLIPVVIVVITKDRYWKVTLGVDPRRVCDWS